MLAEDIKHALQVSIDRRADQYSEVAHQIWELAEMGYLEHKSSGILQADARREGFHIESGVADIPTAFVAYLRHRSAGYWHHGRI